MAADNCLTDVDDGAERISWHNEIKASKRFTYLKGGRDVKKSERPDVKIVC